MTEIVVVRDVDVTGCFHVEVGERVSISVDRITWVVTVSGNGPISVRPQANNRVEIEVISR